LTSTVLARSYSRKSADLVRNRKRKFERGKGGSHGFSFAGLAKKNSNDNATACGFCAAICAASVCNDWLSGRAQHNASAAVRRPTPTQFNGDRAGSFSKKKSYQLGRLLAAISMEFQNPAVVTKATRAPLRWRSVLVPTGGPCSHHNILRITGDLFTASACLAGSAGVENTFRMRSVEPWSQTQSVNVPPLIKWRF